MRLQGAGEGRLLMSDDFFCLGQTDRVLAVSGAQFYSMLKGVKGGHEPGAFLSHQSGAFVIEHGAMFDTIHAGAHGGLDAFGSFRMDHDTFARAMGDFDGFGHLFFT